ncbi:polysaccharide biosynthesis tyrosine autokinase [Ornithinimicrobium sp. LYQ121]|uniref:polysaccharide biosynthesis tyrosine autokinase n=1 Tax=Ornithinimicrobium sp. LYQ121 TaxID=3378801 RepID=UPI0038549577
MELSDYVRTLRRRWRLIVAVTLFAYAVTVLLTVLAPREYRSETQLFISTSGTNSLSELAQGGSFAQRQVTTYALLVTEPVVLAPVLEDLGLDETPGELASRVSARVVPDSVLIEIAVLDRVPAQARDIADAVGLNVTEAVQELERVDATSQSPVKATVVRPAALPTRPDSPDPLFNLALATLLGPLVGLGVALLRDILDTRVRVEADVRRVTSRPTIGAIPFDKDASTHPLLPEIEAFSPRAESFRALRTNLLYVNPDHQPKSLLVTSTVPGEGKTTTTANLALILAASGSSVCLVEGDLRRPKLLDYLGLENAAGLTDVLVKRAALEDVLQPVMPGLSALGCGPPPPNPAEMLGSDAMRTLLDELESQFDYVVIDTPPLVPVTDAALLSTITDGVLVVVGAGIVRRDQLDTALQSLDRIDATVLGIVLNRLPAKGQAAYYYSNDEYAAHRGQGARSRAKEARSRARRNLSGVSLQELETGPEAAGRS